MHSQILEVTPSLADAWMESNTFNRKASPMTVNRYAQDMKKGTWTLNHQGIAFDENGVLVDGQHRLLAVIKSGTTIKMMVTWGASRVGVDELRARSTAEVVKFGGLSDWLDSKSIQTGKQMAALFSGEESARVRSTSEIVDFCEKNKDAIIFSRSLFHTNKRGISTAGCRATVAVSYYHFPQDEISNFVDSLYSGVVSSPRKSAVVRAREFLIEGEFSGGGRARIRAAKRLARAIVAFCDDHPISRLHEPKEFPFFLPEDKR